jgi:amino acid permease
MSSVVGDGSAQVTTLLNGADAVRGKKSYSGVSVVSVTPVAMADSSDVLTSTAAVVGRRKEDGELPKAIDQLGSVALITNNISGPAMMGLPHLFHAAGIVPAVSCILVVWCCASLSGTMLADAIQRIPGNRNFSKNVNFSTAFRLIVGEDWYVIAETLFILSCMVQACAALVETAQSLDGFLASFVLGKTWALQIFPGPALLEWSPEDCKPATEFEVESGLEDCTPFNDAGSLVFTLGFAITTAVFYTLGRGHLKETIVVQIISFAVLFVLLAQFYYEFWARGFQYAETVPWFGTDYSQLAGVVLFNYAFSITVPSWLNEKMPEVSVNRTIWTSTTLSSLIYISFGLLAAFAFENAGSNLLILLSSSQVHYMTRICAAIFGTSIIGCGVPVFCVIIKTALRSGAVCSKPWAQFFGAAFPYCLSWMLYQGTVLMTVLNWTGLLVNGMVAFILPLVLALHASKRIKAGYSHLEPQDSKLIELTISGVNNDSTTSQGKEDGQNNFVDGGTAGEEEDEVVPLWPCIEPARSCIIVAIILLFSCTIAATLLVDTYLDEPTDRR